eukprot:TRINITY_DN6341_c0_g1_i1.p1 TRINITY_DN6341_c0_g1~~TRINITY_DN6341_c0_g1_i1.p1  ORF type:complete len:290 (+),score=67.74 TRINITY_DN6341_c0_g1_i1:59-871(+)
MKEAVTAFKARGPNGKGDDEIRSALKDFNNVNAGRAMFIPEHGEEAKEELLCQIFLYLEEKRAYILGNKVQQLSPQETETLLEIFNTLRILSREDEGMESFVKGKNFELLLFFAGVGEAHEGTLTKIGDTAPPPSSCIPLLVESDLGVEAGKCLVNVVIKLKERILPLVTSSYVPDFILIVLKHPNTRKMRFPLCRVVSHLSTNSTLRDYFNSKLDALSALTDIALEEGELVFGEKKDSDLYLTEVIKSLFHLSLHLGFTLRHSKATSTC